MPGAASYQRSLLRAFQRAAEEARFPFLIVDAPAIRVRIRSCCYVCVFVAGGRMPRGYAVGLATVTGRPPRCRLAQHGRLPPGWLSVAARLS